MKNQVVIFMFYGLLFFSALLISSCNKEEESNNQNPTCSITSPDNGDEFEVGETIIISVDADDTDGSINEVRFFIDGIGKSASSSFPYNYNWTTTEETVGSHEIIVTAYDNSGANSSDKINIILLEPSVVVPVANFTATPTSGTAPLTVTFTDQSTNDPTSWQYDFGDGNTSTEKDPQHTYQAEGNYTVELTVSNSNGSDTETKTNFINVSSGGSAPIADFTASPTTGQAPLQVNFTDQSSNNPTSWQWDFGDGNSSNQPSPSHNYSSEGSYTVSLTVSNQYGNDTKTETNYIIVETAGSAPIADFAASPTSGQAPLQVNFTDQSSNNPTSWQWDFGDGNSSNQPSPSHTYSSEGSYTVSLTVTNEYGGNTETKSSFIIVNSGGGGSDPDGYFTDARDGQEYAFKIIGNQTWMYENLNYQTGNSWCYNEDPANCDIYGRLYDWATIMNGENSSNTVPSGVQGICPSGWHMPSDGEWTILTDYLGGESVAGGKMKEAGTAHWNSPNIGATNSSGFTALPGGYRRSDGSYSKLGDRGNWWSATEISSDAWYRYLASYSGFVYRLHNDKENGYSVRCVRD